MIFLWTKNYKKAKIKKGSHAYKGHASTYNVEVLNSLNRKLHIKDTESAFKNIYWLKWEGLNLWPH